MTTDKTNAAKLAASGASRTEDWDAADDDRAPGEILVVELDGFEGPLDLLLSLARKQKVDLTKISVLALAEQYLSFIAQVRGMRLEIAADYLVMAAWLAYLKSRLLLPKEEEKDEGPSGEELAAQLAFRLKRLEAMRDALKQMMARKKLGVDVFARGMPEGIRTIRSGRYTATVYDLLKAYSEQRKRTTATPHQAGGRTVWSIGDGRKLLTRLVGPIVDWAPIERYLADYLAQPEESRSALASTFGATLELTREGYLELRQATPFGPLHVRWLCEPPVESDAETIADQTEMKEKIA
jgi:segregation and condensation protein A